MTTTEHGSRIRRSALIALLLPLLAGAPAVLAAADEPDAARSERRMRIMERVLDEVLAQSPNVQAALGRSTHSLVLDGFGALFTMDASVGGSWLALAKDTGSLVDLRNDDAEVWVEAGGDKEEGEGKRVQRNKMSLEEWRKQSEATRKKAVDDLVSELTSALLDYGPTLTDLDDQHWLAVAVFLDRGDLMGSGGEHRVVLKAKMRDLRQFVAGGLSRQAMEQRIAVERR